MGVCFARLDLASGVGKLHARYTIAATSFTGRSGLNQDVTVCYRISKNAHEVLEGIQKSQSKAVANAAHTWPTDATIYCASAMRLLKTHSDQLEAKEFLGRERPPYAILSHTWGEDEVQFADLQMPFVRSMKGYRKIRFTLEQAQKDGLAYAWIDTW